MRSTSRLRISLQALAENYQVCSRASAADSVASVVKADAYGLGALQIVQRLIQVGCRHFFVATFAEGERLREALNTHQELTIFVLEGLLDDYRHYLDLGLVPVLNTMQQVERWQAAGAPCVIHVDTGMQRLGLSLGQARALSELPGISISLLITHLANADEPDDGVNKEQRRHLLALKQHLESSLRQNIPFSIGNSAGLFGQLEAESLGRLGIGLYGGNPFTNWDNPCQPVVALEAQIISLREIQAGAAVGYGGTFIAPQTMRIATVGAGYADGIPRLLSNAGEVWLRDTRVPIVGRVSMDLLQIDVTAVAGVADGDWVEIFGSHISIDEVAKLADTISYEILTGLGHRPNRIYLQEKLD
ncbi:MAG: alanine racemase [Pseudomonadota bacterium]